MPAYPLSRAASGIEGFLLEQECRCTRSPVPQVKPRKTPLSSRPHERTQNIHSPDLEPRLRGPAAQCLFRIPTRGLDCAAREMRVWRIVQGSAPGLCENLSR